jgi:hypothetical protein
MIRARDSKPVPKIRIDPRTGMPVVEESKPKSRATKTATTAGSSSATDDASDDEDEHRRKLSHPFGIGDADNAQPSALLSLVHATNPRKKRRPARRLPRLRSKPDASRRSRTRSVSQPSSSSSARHSRASLRGVRTCYDDIHVDALLYNAECMRSIYRQGGRQASDMLVSSSGTSRCFIHRSGICEAAKISALNVASTRVYTPSGSSAPLRSRTAGGTAWA